MTSLTVGFGLVCFCNVRLLLLLLHYPVFQLSQMVIFRWFQSCTPHLFQAYKIRTIWIVEQAFMLFLFSPVWALLLDFHLTLLFLLPTIYPRKHLVQLISIATLFLLLHWQKHGLSVDNGILESPKIDAFILNMLM